MTPLAHEIFRQLAAPIKDRFDPAGLLREYDDLHCFEVSAISPSIYDAVRDREMFVLNGLSLPFFLPTPSTWLEFIDRHDIRYGTLFTTRPDGVIEVTASIRYPKEFRELVPGRPYLFPVALLQPPAGPRASWSIYPPDHPQFEMVRVADLKIPDYEPIESDIEDEDVEPIRKLSEDRLRWQNLGIPILQIVAMLAVIDVINTPGITRMIHHPSHAGLARNLRRNGGFKLNDWHEVLINPDRVVRDKAEGTGAGRKSLHFVRAHRRVFRDGTQTQVRAHWRGDPALGIKQKRYRVERPIN